jgi:hypothetical protein
MSFDPKTAAEELLKLADLIEEVASVKTIFSCEKCKHSAPLSVINTARSEFAKKQATELNVEVEAQEVTVNDKIACPGCGSAMAYEPTAESEKFYVESAADDSLADLDLDFGTEEDKKDKPKEEKKEKKDPVVDEPVDKEPPKEEPPKEDSLKEEPPKEAPKENPASDETPVEEPAVKEPPKEEQKKDDVPEDDIFEPVDEQAAKQEQEKVEEEDKKKKAPKKDKEDKEDKPTPKFEKMPKEASDRFVQKLARYSL